MNKDSNINVALIGYGYAGQYFHGPLISETEGLHLKTIVSSQIKKIKADSSDVTVVGSAEEAINDRNIDLVVLATPNETHASLAEMAIKAGKNVVVDKPFTLTLHQARHLQSLAHENQVLLSVFHNRRWDSDYLGIKEVIESGKLGRVVHFESHIDKFQPLILDRWRDKNLPGSGLWFDIGPHITDQALQLFGLPESIQANIAGLRDNAEIDDWAHVVLNYAKHKVILNCTMLSAGGVSRFTVHGTKGSVTKREADKQEDQLVAGIRPGTLDWGVDSDDLALFDANLNVTSLPSPRGDQRQYYFAIRDTLLGIRENPVPPLHAIAVMAVIDAAYSSAKTGCTVELPLTTPEKENWVSVS
ncbi:oxidoreductase [Pantoea sp. S61]|uniref:oxidoreductase n=1 Tax=Pantoea sp. S61 TaxID=2767442 RepID=UPI00351BED08